MLKRSCVALVLLLLAAGCGQVPTTAPPGRETAPAVDNSGWTVLPAADTPIPYPLPTHEIRTAPPLPSPTPLPVVPVLGEEWAPEAERETYVSTTVIVAKVGDGPGEVGYQTHGEALPSKADEFTVDGHGNIYILDRVNQRVVKFDSQGRFTQNIPYPGREELLYPEVIAADMEGRIYLYDAGFNPEMAGVQCYDAQGSLVRRYPAPSWFKDGHILAMQVDKQGMLWVQGEGYAPNAPIIDGQPYSLVSVPLGNAAGVLDEDQQKALAISGHLLPSGKSMIVYLAYVYDPSGQPMYRIVEGISAIDLVGNLYYYKEGDKGYTIVKWNPKGQRIASFDLPFGIIQVEGDGTVYCFTMDRQTWATYYVIRASPK